MLLNHRSFREYIEHTDFMDFYKKNIYPKKGGGRDNLTPATYIKTFKNEIDNIKKACIEGTYKFAPYKEKLVLKGRDRYPRVLSIPIVRDRFVLSLLNGYLSETWKVSRPAPNTYIHRIARFIEKSTSENKNIYFCKTDIASFYDNISHSRLIRILSPVIDGSALKLIINAATTPTIAHKQHVFALNERGIPQGLSISSILAGIYMEDFHMDMERTFADGLFLRYVDDILVLSNRQYHFLESISKGIMRHSLGVELSESKTIQGDLSKDSFEYIGYKVKGNRISVKKANLDKFADRIAGRCIQMAKAYADPLLRPRFVDGDDEYLKYVESELNLLISGFRIYNHNYGWIAYFQQITDITALYHLDNMIRKHLGAKLYSKLKINSIVKSYHDIRRNSGKSIIINFDSVTDRAQKIAYLQRFGFIQKTESRNLSDTEVDNRFNIMVHAFVRESKVDLKELS